ncbi:MAG: methylmalonyl-CoA decarboxylase [Isosphaeraceae bacterium]
MLKQIDGQTGIITLNNDAKRNALSRALIDELVAALDEMNERQVRSVIVRAQPGVKVWSAGHDATELPTSGRDPLGYDDPLRRAVRAIATIPVPVIAMIEGTVWGGACELAITCDLIVATPDVTFALTPAKLGVPYNTAGFLNLMNAIEPPLLKEMLFTARPIPVERILHHGMINQIVPREDLEATALQLAATIAEMSPMCIALIKEELGTLAASRPLSAETFERLQALRRRVYDSQDYREGIRSFLEKRPPRFRGE